MHWNKKKKSPNANTLATQAHEHVRQSASSTSIFRYALFMFKPYILLWIKSVQFTVH